MSFTRSGDRVQNGDIVILSLGHNSMQCLKAFTGREHYTRFGTFAHDDIIGKAFGSKIFCQNRKGWTYVLRPSPELWTVTLPHRTQILYTADISLIVFELELKPGSIVVESGSNAVLVYDSISTPIPSWKPHGAKGNKEAGVGNFLKGDILRTGSGSISHAFTRSIMPSGHLYTYDFHSERAEQASAEFTDHGLDSYVTVSCQDVSSCGFGLRRKADAVFLDLPMPWSAIDFAKDALKVSGGRLCSFSPCIEQVQKTQEKLRRSGFYDIKTVECISKSLDIRTVPFTEAKFSKESPADVVDECSAHWNDSLVHLSSTKEGSSSKRTYFPALEDHTRAPCHTTQRPGSSNFLAAQGLKDIPGHTGYLTFASLLPLYK